MLEIFLLWHFCKKMGLILRDKGRQPTGYQAMLVAMWFGGEILGGIAGVVVTGGTGLPAYLFGIMGAVAGVISAFAIAKSVSPLASRGYEPTGGFPVQPTIAEPLDQRRY